MMLIILSPSKTIAKIDTNANLIPSQPMFLENSKPLVDALRKLSQKEIEELMSISPQLARLNVERFISWSTPFDKDNSHPALVSFKGDVYEGINAEDFTSDDFAFAQNHLRILSGLYGALRPLDLMQPYRLEMGAKFGIGKSNNLYDYWKTKLNENINTDLNGSGKGILVNLASNEYSKALDFKALKGEVITPIFKEQTGNTYKTIAIHAKRARGLMTRFIIKNKIDDVEKIKLFDYEGYYFSPNETKGNDWVFLR
jgi:hypothetical protein